ncbi:MAG: RNA polymerase sigma-70 factor [Bacteroidales bacterium]|nr:RNA polymerase sigma-70 factor [Bacteroidales bacterium]
MKEKQFITDNHLFNSFREGNENSFALIFEKYYPILVVFAKKYLTDLDLSKGIVQDFFVKFYEKKNEIEINTSLKSYLYLSVKNTCLNYIERKKTQNKHQIIIEHNSTDISDEVSNKIEETELEYEIFKYIEKLPEQCKRIFKMSRVEYKKNQEIADELQISKRTVETQISKALRILRESLSHHLKWLIFITLHFF